MTSQNNASSMWCPGGQLNFDELKTLSTTNTPTKCLEEKVKNELEKTVIKQPPLLSTSKLEFNKDLQKRYIKVAHWNIERGFNIDVIKKILNDTSRYLKEDLDKEEYPYKTQKYNDLLSEIEELKNADVLLLNEVDNGIGRTNYKNIADELAQSLNAGYVYATEFLEVDPALLNTVKEKDRWLYRGEHGNAIISKFPIKNARLVRLPVVYDWFTKERERLTLLEQAKREAAKVTVNEEVFTEVRHGSRIALIAELQLPNMESITVVSTHFEDRTTPKNREKQMQALLNEIKNIKTPIVLGGDLNSFEFDSSPTSVTKVVKSKATDVNFLGKTALTLVNPFALATNVTSTTVSQYRKYKDPTVASIPVLLPNKVRKLFKMIETFRFNDGYHFDFSGEPKYSFEKRDGELSNSNQRGNKGFIETLKLDRSYKVARYKIDWLFVKPIGTGIDKKYFPAFGRTLKNLNYSYKNDRISDHNPVTVDVII